MRNSHASTLDTMHLLLWGGAFGITIAIIIQSFAFAYVVGMIVCLCLLGVAYHDSRNRSR